ncbi:MAB_1171c family putative transporter [Saccharothrix saharensis]|uniref:MAB_1171c family putative transporter n=1 Tax=Saccharothrix saharensis TaxID=571190 RepID=UPI0011506E48|nr:MAB_1171c family putative transporter [Saccharothrix saharensis]
MLSFVIPVVLVVTTALGFWASSYRQTRNAGVRAMCMALLLLDVGMLVGYLNVVGRTWHPVLAMLPLQLVQHVAVLGAAFYLKMFCLHLTAAPERVAAKARRRRVVLAVALVALTTFYLLGPWQAGLTEVHSAYGNQRWVAPYLAVYSAYFAWAMLDVLLMSRFARHIDRRHLRVGLRLLGAGSVGGLLYVVHRIGFGIVAAFGVPVEPDANGWSESTVLVTSAITLLMAGVLVPPLGARWEARRFHARLQPLWAELTSVAPELVYSPSHRRGDRLRIRVTEMRDILIGPLHAYLDPQVATNAGKQAARLGLPEPEARAVAEAATIAVALEAKRRDLPPITAMPVVIGEADDVAQLVLIADAFADSPIVADTVKEFRSQHDHAH